MSQTFPAKITIYGSGGSGNYPDQGLPGVEGPTDPGYGHPEGGPPHISGGPIVPPPLPGIWPPGGVGIAPPIYFPPGIVAMPPIYIPTEPPPTVGGGPVLPPGIYPPLPPPELGGPGLPGKGSIAVIVLVHYNDKWHPHWYVFDPSEKPPTAGPK
jgi:hypothetical protein